MVVANPVDMHHHPYVALALAGARRFVWAAFGASLATAFFATRAWHAPTPIGPSIAGSAPPVNVVATVVVPPLERAAPPSVTPAPTLAAPTYPTARAPAPRRALGPADANACSRAWAEGGVYRAAYGVTYVTRATVDQALEDQAQLMRAARIVHEQIDGRTVGIRLFGIRPGSFMDRLGFQNGDSLRTIDGYEVALPERALEAYAMLRTADDYHVAVVRLGARHMLIYRIC